MLAIGGPTFPALLLGAAGGIAMSHLPGLPMIAGAAMGIGAMSAVMLTLPLTSVLLPVVLLPSDGARPDAAGDRGRGRSQRNHGTAYPRRPPEGHPAGRLPHMDHPGWGMRGAPPQNTIGA
jgi:hypothetical protein